MTLYKETPGSYALKLLVCMALTAIVVIIVSSKTNPTPKTYPAIEARYTAPSDTTWRLYVPVSKTTVVMQNSVHKTADTLHVLTLVNYPDTARFVVSGRDFPKVQMGTWDFVSVRRHHGRWQVKSWKMSGTPRPEIVVPATKLESWL